MNIRMAALYSPHFLNLGAGVKKGTNKNVVMSSSMRGMAIASSGANDFICADFDNAPLKAPLFSALYNPVYRNKIMNKQEIMSTKKVRFMAELLYNEQITLPLCSNQDGLCSFYLVCYWDNFLS